MLRPTSSVSPAVLVLSAMLGMAMIGITTTGCGATVRSAAAEAPRIAVPVTIDAALLKLEDDATRARLEELMATPEMRRIMREAAEELTKGALATLTGEASRADRERIEKEVERTVTQAATNATRAAIRSASEEIPSTLGPAIRQSLVKELQSKDLEQALATLVSNATRQALISSRDVIIELKEARSSSGEEGFLSSLRSSIRRGLTIAIAIAVTLGALSVTLVFWVLKIRNKNKRYKAALRAVIATEDSGDSAESRRAQLRRLVDVLS